MSSTPPTVPIRLGLISEGASTWPVYVAQRLKLFEREGLTVDVKVIGSSVKQQEALIAGKLDVGVQQPDHVVRAVERGADLFVFAPHAHGPELTLVAARDVRAIGDLRGRTIAVDGARTGYSLLLMRWLRRNGIGESEVVLREIGGSQERFDAIRSGAADATLLNPPFDANLLAEGYTSLARMSEAFPDYPGSVMAARRSWAKAHRRQLRAFTRTLARAYDWLAKPENAGEALDLLPSRLAIAPRAAGAMLKSFAKKPRPRLTPDGMRQVIDTVWEAEGYDRPKAAPEKYVDLSYSGKRV